MNKFLVLLVFAVTLAWAGISPGWSRSVLAQGSDAPGGTKLDFDVGTDDQSAQDGPVMQAERERERAERKAAKAVRQTGALIFLCLLLLIFVCYWIIFTKAGKPGWAAIIPIYNVIVLLEICGRPLWWFLLLMIPCVQAVVGVILAIDLAKSFGKGVGFAIGLILLGIVFLPILAFGSARYRGPAAAA
jgi:hypothetical protein